MPNSIELQSNQSGQSLIQVMIGMVLLGVLAMFFAQMNTSAIKGQNSVRLSSDFNHFASLVALALQNQSVCTANLGVSGNFSQVTFNTTSPQPITINQLTYPTGGGIIVRNGASPSQGLTVSALQIKQFQTLTAGTDYLATLHIEVTKTKGTFSGASIVQEDIPLYLKTTVSGSTATIIQCNASTISSTTDLTMIQQQVCASMGGAWAESSCTLPAPPGPPACSGSNQALQWTGSSWSCVTISGGGGSLTGGTCSNGQLMTGLNSDGTPQCSNQTTGGTPCGSGNQGMTMYSGGTRYCCFLSICSGYGKCSEDIGAPRCEQY